MKKYLFSFAVLAMAMSLLTACSKDDDDTPSAQPVNVSNGMFLVGSGNKKAGVDGNVSYVDYTHGWSVQDIFRQANAKSVGKTANYITAYGSKLYIVVDAEATIWVCNKQTLKIEKQISTTQLLGETDGISPRSALGYDGKLYFACYGNSTNNGNGIVAVIDTINFAKQKTYEVGSYPNGLALCGDNLFVTNSDYGNNKKPSLSKIDLKSGIVTEIKDDKTREVERKLFPGYVMVKMVMNDDTWYIVRNIRGCTGFVGPGSKPIPLTDEEVARMGVESKVVEVNYAVGDTVNVIDGTMVGFSGKVAEIDTENNFVRVIISMFGRETPVEFQLNQLELAKSED